MRVGGTASTTRNGTSRSCTRLHQPPRRPQGDDASILTVKTRVRLTDADSRRRFKRYWLVVGPISSLIRDTALRQLTTRLHRAPRDGAADDWDLATLCDRGQPHERGGRARRTYRRAAVAVDSRT